MKPIGIDIDNVLAEFEAPFRAWLNRHGGLKLKRRHIVRYQFSECCPLSDERVSELFWDFVGEGWLRKLAMIPGARAGLAELSGHSSLRLITSRPDEGSVKADTRFWLEAKGLPHMGRSLVFAGRKEEVAGEISLLIEDSLEQAARVAASGVPVVLLDYPWNRDGQAPLPEGIIRVKGWSEVVACVRGRL